MLDENDPWLDRVRDSDVVDPLSTIARKERTTLLIANTVMFAVFQMGLVPTKIDFLGLETDRISAGAVMVASLIAVVYFTLSFYLTTRSEHRAWRSRLDSLRDNQRLRREFYLKKSLQKMSDSIGSALSRAGQSFTDDEERDLRAHLTSQDTQNTLETWDKYKEGYETRLFVDVRLPLIITALNLVATAITVAIHPALIHGN